MVPLTPMGITTSRFAWLHMAMARNFVFCDGHAKWEYRGQLTDANWDVRCYARRERCTGHSYPPNPADYPAVSSSSGGYSALDCE